MNCKLVIWDLDETFWKGTLSEGDIEKIERNIKIVKTLVDRGIMNSIVSKNDFDKAMEVLKSWNMDEYFIFPQISWEPKGKTVRSLLKMCGLRAENTVFIDDNISNREEVKYYNRGIICYDPQYLELNNILDNDSFIGKDDLAHNRLKQYHIMEKRAEKGAEYSSNEEFLRASNITISLKDDCIAQIERIDELIQRTNQLNYTKNRMNREELEEILNDENVNSKYIVASDNFGEYGIVGFFSLKNNSFIHFLFSCRILGFGIENYVYNKLNCPDIDITGEVATELVKNVNIDWISEKEMSLTGKNQHKIVTNSNKTDILMIGGCDLEQAGRYLEGTFSVRKEFATVINGEEIRTSDTCQIINAITLSENEKDELCQHIPFFEKEVTFGTQLYSHHFKIIIISVVDDYIRGIYKEKELGYKISYNAYWEAEDILKQKYEQTVLDYINQKFIFEGKESTEDFKANLEKIISLIDLKNTKLIFINGAEIDVSEWIGKERCDRNIEMNRALDEVLQLHREIGLVDMRKIVTDKEQLTKQDNRHFDRNCYYQMAKEIIRLAEASVLLKEKSIIKVKMEEKFNVMKCKIKNVFLK